MNKEAEEELFMNIDNLIDELPDDENILTENFHYENVTTLPKSVFVFVYLSRKKYMNHIKIYVKHVKNNQMNQ